MTRTFSRLAALGASAVLAASAGGASAQEGEGDALQGPQSRTLVVVAHPDDELFFAPAIARAAREGAHHTIVFATSGDQGPGVTDLDRGAALAARREEEALCSAAALGAGEDVRFLRLGDGKLTSYPRRADSAARMLAAALEQVLRDGQYDTVISWGPDGGYGHGDHRMVSAIATQVVQAMGENRPALLYPGIRNGTLPPVAELQSWATTDPSLLTVAYRYDEDDLAAVREAVDCHETQFSRDQREQMADLFHASIWQGEVHFRPAIRRGETTAEDSAD